MSLLQRIVSAFKPSSVVRPSRLQNARPRPGQWILPRPEDRWRDYPADAITPARLAATLRAADSGSPAEAMQLYEQLEESDPHLYSVATTRRLALTGLDWQILSAADLVPGMDRTLADEAADFARRTLASLDAFDDVLQHLALALGRNIALAELVWDVVGGVHRLVDLVPVDFARVCFDDLDRPRILTQDHPNDGILLPPNKFIVHTPHCVSGHPARGGLLRVTAFAWLGKHYTVRDWLMFTEVFGLPVRIARYEPAATAEEKRELMAMLRSVGTDAAAVFSKAVDLELLEANKGSPAPPFESLCNFLNREISKAWLGQTLTAETVGVSGTLAAAMVHDEVRQDLREDDIRKEARTLRRDLLRPLVQLKFGRDVPVPFFRRKLDPPRDLRELADILSVAVGRLGLRVPARWAHETLGIPRAAEGDEVLSPPEKQ